MTDKPTFVYVTYIASTPEKVWDALTDADLTAAYWGHSNVSDWQAGLPLEHVRTDGSGIADVVGTVVESERPTRLVTTWAAPENEGQEDKYSRVTYDIRQHEDIVRLTVSHEDLADEGELSDVSGGWPAVLSNLKTVLETGSPLSQAPWLVPRPLSGCGRGRAEAGPRCADRPACLPAERFRGSYGLEVLFAACAGAHHARTTARPPMMTLFRMTPVSGLLPTIHGETIIQTPRALMAQLRPYMRSGALVNPRASRPIAMRRSGCAARVRAGSSCSGVSTGYGAVQTEQEHRSVHERHIASTEHAGVACLHFGYIGMARYVTSGVRDVGHELVSFDLQA